MARPVDLGAVGGVKCLFCVWVGLDGVQGGVCIWGSNDRGSCSVSARESDVFLVDNTRQAPTETQTQRQLQEVCRHGDL